MHVSQAPVHALPQHTPAVQIPDAQCCAPPTQPEPFESNAWHCPELQKYPAAQLASTAHPVEQEGAVPLHKYGEQLGTPGVPPGSSEHVPTSPVRSQCSHDPELQAELQQ